MPKPDEEPALKLKPAVPIKQSITPDYLICLDDGKRFKSLRRHLAVLGMTPDEYRAKWGLPDDYPMVASGYSTVRSKLAKASVLGKDRKTLAQADQLMDHTALSPVEHETATLAPIIEDMQLDPVADMPAELEIVTEKVAQRRGRPTKMVSH